MAGIKMMFRKTAILIGGSSGDFGPALAQRFSKTWIKRWNVINIDSKPNPVCKHNVVLDFSQPIPESAVEEIHKLITDNQITEIDAMVNVVSTKP